jgi:hypothetical protein
MTDSTRFIKDSVCKRQEVIQHMLLGNVVIFIDISRFVLNLMQIPPFSTKVHRTQLFENQVMDCHLGY